jgi:hypothetical protein
MKYIIIIAIIFATILFFNIKDTKDQNENEE